MNSSSVNHHRHPKAIWWLGRPKKTSETAIGCNGLFSDTSRWFVLNILGAAVEGYKWEEERLQPLILADVLNMVMGREFKSFQIIQDNSIQPLHK